MGKAVEAVSRWLQQKPIYEKGEKKEFSFTTWYFIYSDKAEQKQTESDLNALTNGEQETPCDKPAFTLPSFEQTWHIVTQQLK